MDMEGECSLQLIGNEADKILDGRTEDGGHLQTYQCFFGNTNQMWAAETIDAGAE